MGTEREKEVKSPKGYLQISLDVIIMHAKAYQQYVLGAHDLQSFQYVHITTLCE